ncbi:MAG: DUF2442 domain-containing protein [Anaerolinea sp.]|nr:DUF2442 domain-containing protein [Anaerolinea sp.]
MTSSDSNGRQASAVLVRFDGNRLVLGPDDGREISVDMERVSWLRWLREADASARANWALEPGGYAVYWPDLDDGVEVRHLLAGSLVA